MRRLARAFGRLLGGLVGAAPRLALALLGLAAVTYAHRHALAGFVLDTLAHQLVADVTGGEVEIREIGGDFFGVHLDGATISRCRKLDPIAAASVERARAVPDLGVCLYAIPHVGPFLHGLPLVGRWVGPGFPISGVDLDHPVVQLDLLRAARPRVPAPPRTTPDRVPPLPSMVIRHGTLTLRIGPAVLTLRGVEADVRRTQDGLLEGELSASHARIAFPPTVAEVRHASAHIQISPSGARLTALRFDGLPAPLSGAVNIRLPDALGGRLAVTAVTKWDVPGLPPGALDVRVEVPLRRADGVGMVRFKEDLEVAHAVLGAAAAAGGPAGERATFARALAAAAGLTLERCDEILSHDLTHRMGSAPLAPRPSRTDAAGRVRLVAWANTVIGEIAAHGAPPPVTMRIGGRGIPAGPFAAAYRIPGVRATLATDPARPVTGAILGKLWEGASGEIHVIATDIRYRDLALDTAHLDVVRGRATGGAWAATPGERGLITIALRGAAGHGDAQGSVGTDGSLTLDTVDAWLADLASLRLPVRGEPVAGVAHFQGRGGGRLKAPTLDGTLECGPGRIGGVAVDHVAGTVHLGPGKFQATGISAAAGADRLDTGDLLLTWAKGKKLGLVCRADVSVEALEGYAQSVGRFTFPFGASATGPVELVRTNGQMSGRATLRLPVFRLGKRAIGGGLLNVGFKDRTVSLETLQITRGTGGSLTVSGALHVDGRDLVGTLDTCVLRSAVGRETRLPAGAPCSVTWRGGAFTLEDLVLEGPGANMQVGGTIGHEGALDIRAKLGSTDIEIFTDWLGVTEVTGKVQTGQLHVSGTLDEPVISAGIQVAGLSAGPLRGARLDVDATLQGGRLRLTRGQLDTPAGERFAVTGDLPDPLRLIGRGAAALGAVLLDPALRLTVVAKGLRPGSWLPRDAAGVERTGGVVPEARLDLLGGPEGATGQLSATLVGASISGHPFSATCHLDIAPGVVRLRDVHGALWLGAWRVTGQVPLPPRGALVPPGPEADATAVRTWLAQASLSLQATLANVDLAALPARPGGAPITGGATVVVGLEGSLSAPRTTVDLQAANGRVMDLTDLEAAVHIETDPAHADRLVSRNSTVRGVGLDLRLDGWLPVALGFEADGTRLRLRRPFDAAGDAGLSIQARDGDLAAVARAFRWPVAVGGRLDFECQMRGSWERPSWTATLKGRDLSAPGVEKGHASAEFIVSGPLLEMRSLEIDTSRGSLVASGSLAAPGGWAEAFRTRAADVDASVRMPGFDLSLLPLWLPKQFRRASGRVGLEATARGPIAGPRLAGAIALREIEATFQRVIPQIKRLTGTIRLEDRAALVLRNAPLTGALGDGPTELWGRCDLDGWMPGTFVVEAVAKGALLLNGDTGLRIRADLSGSGRGGHEGIRLTGRREGGRTTGHVAGTVRATSGRYTRDYFLLALKDRGEVVRIGFRIPGFAEVTTDIAVQTARPIHILNNIADTGLRIPSTLRVTGPTHDLVLDGELVAEKGSVKLPIPVDQTVLTLHRMRIIRASVRFDRARPRTPHANGKLEIETGGYTISASFNSDIPFKKLQEITFSSQPSLSDAAIYSMVLFGVPGLTDWGDVRASFGPIIGNMAIQFLSPEAAPGSLADRIFFEPGTDGSIGGTSLRAGFRLTDLVQLYGAREGDGSYHGGLSLRQSFARPGGAGKPADGTAGR